MTLKKSSVNTFAFTFRKTFSKSFWIPLAILIFNSYLVLADIISFIVNYNEYLIDEPETAASMIKETVYKLSLSGSSSFMQMIWGALIIIASVTTAASVFRFMMNKSAVNVWYSLGMTRRKLFWSKFLAGAFALTISSVFPFVVSLILNICMFGRSTELWLAAMYLALSFWTLTLITYSIAACTFCSVGTTLEGVFFSLVYCVLPSIAEMFIEECYSNFLYGSPISSESWSNMGQVSILGVGHHAFSLKSLGIFGFTFFPASSEHANIASLNINETFSVNFIKPLVAVVILVFLAFIGVAVHGKRKAEIAGFLGSNPLATGIVVFTSAMLINTFLMQYFVDVSINRYFICAVLAILVFAVIYIIADAVSLRSLKLIIKKLWKFPIHLGVFFAVILLFSTGLFGYSSRIPDLADIKSVSISTNTADTFVDYKNINYNNSDYLFENETIDEFLAIGNNIGSAAGNFTDRTDIEKIVSIHKQLIDCKNLEVTTESVCASYAERVVPTNIAVIYNLKDGKTFERVYYVATEDILCQLADLTLTENYKSLAVKSLEYGENETSYVGDQTYSDLSMYIISPNMSNVTSVPSFDKTDILSLFDAVSKDIENDSLPLNFRSDSDVIGYIKISADDEYSVTYSSGISSDDTMFAENVFAEEIIEDNNYHENLLPYNLNSEYDGIKAGGRGILIPVFADMKNTIAFADSNSLSQYFNDTARPVKVNTWKLDECAESEYLWKYASMTSLTAGFWSNGKKCSENEAQKGGIVEEAEYLDYYNRIPELPESSKTVTDSTEIERIQKEARIIALTCYDGEYVQFIFEDGSMTFGYIPA